jgi:hypothetical protein
MLAGVLFEPVTAQGFREATIQLADIAIAHGFAVVILERLALTVECGRGERTDGHFPTDGLIPRDDSTAIGLVRSA